MNPSRRMADCGMTAALSIVLMLVGAVLGIGMYISPMLAGFLLLPIGKKYGTKYQWILWAAVSLISLMLVPNAEQNLMYIALFGLYPILYPRFERLPLQLKWPCKLMYLNLTVIAVEALVTLVLTPEAMGVAMTAILMILFNAVFVVFDHLIPRAEIIFRRIFGKFKR